MTAQAPAINEAKVEEFLGKALGDLAGTMTVLQCAIGDELGLFKDLATNGGADVTDFAQRTGLNERYAREWLGAMASAGYIDYDASTARFTMPNEHALVLAQENGPMFFGGVYEMVSGIPAILDTLTTAFRNGGGVAQSEYPPSTWSGMERFTAGWFDNQLIQIIIPALPELKAALERGVDVADVGCGSGRALIRLAEAFPNSRFVGYDLFEGQLERARRNIEAAGLSDRIRVELADASKGLPEQYDVVTTFDVVHDAADPLGVMKTARDALRPDGFYVCMDINCSDKLEENLGPLGALFYGFSVLYCMTTSLAQGGAGLGTLGLHEPKLRELGTEAGFTRIERTPVEDPFNVTWVLRP